MIKPRKSDHLRGLSCDCAVIHGHDRGGFARCQRIILREVCLLSFNEEKAHIGARKAPVEGREDSIVSYVMETMPTPTHWGVEPTIAKGKGHMCLLRGKIFFYRVNLAPTDRIYVPPEPEETPPVSPADLDPADRLLGNDRKRPVFSRENDIDLFALEEQIQKKLRGKSGSPYEMSEDERLTRINYRSTKEIRRARYDLEKRANRLRFGLIELTVVTLFLCALELVPAFGLPFPAMFTPDGAPAVYLGISLAGLCFAAAISFRDMAEGLRNLVHRVFNTRTVLTIATATEIGHILYMLLLSLVFHKSVTNTFAGPVCFAVTIYTANRLMHTLRVARGFGFVAKKGLHSALLSAEDSPVGVDLRLASGSRNAKVCYLVRTRILSGYFKNACREDSSSLIMARLYPWLLLIAGVTALIGGIRGVWRGDDFLAVGSSALNAALVTSVPITGLLCLEIPLSVTTKKLLRKGALLNGWNAVEKFGDTDAFAVNTTDLFPRGSIRVIKALAVSDMEIEEVTASAASLLMASGGALGEVFGALIRNENRLRDSVDGMFYENELGMSGFLRERRVLVGNREMMTTHRVVIAGGGLKRLDEFEAMADKLGQQVLYVAVNNRLVGVYLLEYKASASVRSALVQIISDGTNLMIYTCDANINVKLITQVFDLPPRFISILDNEGSRVYDSVTYAVTDSEEALLATNGSLKELSSAIRAAVRMKETERLGLLIQSICFVMGFLFVVILSVISPYAIDASQVLMMQAVFVIISLFSVLRAL